MKKITALIILLCILTGALSGIVVFASGDEYEDSTEGENDSLFTAIDSESIKAKAAVLIDATTGTLLYAKNPNEALPPASVTKIMTLLLVAEALRDGRIKSDDKIYISNEAASMGGSQIFLEEGEEFSVEELIKSTVIASANDAAFALAEHVGGSVDGFVDQMNAKAKELGMKNTVFENVTGLDDDTVNHVCSAYDIAIMSQELIKHDVIMKYSKIWQDTIRDGEFTLTNTNRLVRYYKGCTGLKTGSTDKAGFCISASAMRNGMHLIAVIMGSDTRDERNAAARTLLDWGFANYRIYSEAEAELEKIPVKRSTIDEATAYAKKIDILIPGADEKKIEKRYNIPEYLMGDLKSGEVIGEIVYTINGKEIGKTDIYVQESADAIDPIDIFFRLFGTLLLGKK